MSEIERVLRAAMTNDAWEALRVAVPLLERTADENDALKRRLADVERWIADMRRPPCWGPDENGDMWVDLQVWGWEEGLDRLEEARSGHVPAMRTSRRPIRVLTAEEREARRAGRTARSERPTEAEGGEAS